MKTPSWPELVERPAFGHAVIALVFLALGTVFVTFGITPVHDAIGGYGPFHYFCEWLARGVVPYWNPYQLTGRPFYPDFQLYGLWEPSNYLFILLYKLTGCTILTAFLWHYLFYYWLFIEGSYWTFSLLTRKPGPSLLFSLVLLMGLFPAVMRQNAMINPFFALPLTTYVLLRLFDEPSPERKGPLLFLASCLIAVSFLVYLPSYLVFYLLWFVGLAAVLEVADLHEISRFAKTKSGVLWIAASALAFVLIIAPLIALLRDSGAGGELFPFARVQLSHSHQFPRYFISASDVSLFSRHATLWVSIAIGNLFGLLLEPRSRLLNLPMADIPIYIGILPLFWVYQAVSGAFSAKDRRPALFLVLALALALIMSSFGDVSDHGLFQRVLVAVIPTLGRLELFEAFATPFLFCLVAASAAGYAMAPEGGTRGFWATASAALIAKYVFLAAGDASPLSLLVVCGFALGAYHILNRSARLVPTRTIRAVSIILLFLDLTYFNLAHIREQVFYRTVERPEVHLKEGEGAVLERVFYRTLLRDGLLAPRRERPFENYREAYLTASIYNFSGQEMLRAVKTALPPPFGASPGQIIFWAAFDSAFCTRRYYDYFVNVDLQKQLVTSSVIAPILNFFPKRAATTVSGPFAAVAAMNRVDLREAKRHIFIESNWPAPTSPPTANTASEPSLLAPTAAELSALASASTSMPKDYPKFEFKVRHHGPNDLSVALAAPEDGYFFFGDGYSRYWEASVDGKAARIEKTNANFKSVVVTKGHHLVDFVYDPEAIRLGMLLSALGVLGAALLSAGALLLKRRAESSHIVERELTAP